MDSSKYANVQATLNLKLSLWNVFLLWYQDFLSLTWDDKNNRLLFVTHRSPLIDHCSQHLALHDETAWTFKQPYQKLDTGYFFGCQVRTDGRPPRVRRSFQVSAFLSKVFFTTTVKCLLGKCWMSTHWLHGKRFVTCVTCLWRFPVIQVLEVFSL